MQRHKRRQAYKYGMRKAARYASAAASSGLAGLYAATKSGSAPSYSKKKHNGIGVTFQRDKSNVYRRRRMPYKKRKRWVRFVKKVNAVDERELGTRTVLFNKTVNFSNLTPQQQVLGYCALYPLQCPDPGTGFQSHMNDLKGISGLENQGNPTAVSGERVGPSTKMMFHSAVMDLTVRNNSFVTGQPEGSGNTLELDVYEVISSKKWNDASGTKQNIIQALEKGDAETPVIGGTGNPITIQDRGCTPWELPAGISRYGLKILKKTKYFLQGGQTMTYQIRDASRHVTTVGYLDDSLGVNKPGWTRHVFLIGKSVPGTVLGAGTGQVTELLSLGVTRKYMYKVEGLNESRDEYTNA